MIVIFKKDEKPKFQFTLKDEDGNLIDLTAATVANCYIRKDGDTANKFTLADTDAVFIVPRTSGRIDYQLPTGGIDTAGMYSGQLLVTYADGKQQTERFQFMVEEGLRP